MIHETKKRSYAIIPVLVLTFALGFYAAKSTTLSDGKSVNPTTQTSPTFFASKISIPYIDDVYKILQDKYIDTDKIKLEDMQNAALKGFVRGIGDPYTAYMPPEESKEFEIDLEGELEGIGAVLEQKNDVIVVVSAIKDSPAKKAGLKSGDVISKIDGITTAKLSLIDAVKKIRGKKGTQISITILRKGEPKPIDLTLIRDSIHIDSIETEVKENIFHVTINQFNQTTRKEFDNVVQKALLEKPRGMIIDVRGNGGGFLDTSIDIIAEFMKKDTIIARIKSRDPKNNENMKSGADGRLTDIPVVVLIDGGSASASEILAGAFQDTKRGILIGETSFGKGSVQELSKIRNGGLIRTTIAKWYTPNDQNIDQTGIKPDIEVKYTEADFKAQKDPQLEEAFKYLNK